MHLTSWVHQSTITFHVCWYSLLQVRPFILSEEVKCLHFGCPCAYRWMWMMISMIWCWDGLCALAIFVTSIPFDLLKLTPTMPMEAQAHGRSEWYAISFCIPCANQCQYKCWFSLGLNLKEVRWLAFSILCLRVVYSGRVWDSSVGYVYCILSACLHSVSCSWTQCHLTCKVCHP